MQATDQQVTMVPSDEASNKIAQIFGEAETAKVDIAVDTAEDAYKELVRRTNLDKRVVLDTLMGYGKMGFDPKVKVSLPILFKTYFKGQANQIYTQSDLETIAKLLGQEKEDAAFEMSLATLKPKVKKGFYDTDRLGLKRAFIYRTCVAAAGQVQVLIGASRPEYAIYFLFTNEKTDVNNGVIYVRQGATSVIKRVNTFEVNPFVRGRGIVTDPETGASEVKDQLTFNPGWLNHTINNMERYVFAPLAYIPPRPKMPKTRHRVGEGEVDMNALIEKTLADAKIDPAKAGEKVAEEVRTGIDNYAATAMAKIAERDGKVDNANASGAVMQEGETLQGDSPSLTEQMREAFNPGDDVAVFDEPDYGAQEPIIPVIGADGLTDCQRMDPPCLL
jgi:hypothetical protein